MKGGGISSVVQYLLHRHEDLKFHQQDSEVLEEAETGGLWGSFVSQSN